MVRNSQGGLKASGQRNSVVIQWLRLSALMAEDLGLIPGQETKIPQILRLSHKNKQTKPHKSGAQGQADSSGTEQRRPSLLPRNQEGVSVRMQGPILGRK